MTWNGPERRGADRLSDEIWEVVQHWTAPYKLKILELEDKNNQLWRKIKILNATIEHMREGGRFDVDSAD